SPEETGSNVGRVAIAWVSVKGAIPIIGPRTRAQLNDNLAATEASLTADHIRRLDDVSAILLDFSLTISWRLRRSRTASPVGSVRFSTCRLTRCADAEPAL